MSQLSGLVWFILMLVPLILLQRLLHREFQSVLLILTRDTRLTMGIFSILFLPGVFLHELSHFMMAKVLRVRTGKFSVFPQSLPDGRLQPRDARGRAFARREGDVLVPTDAFAP